MGFRRLPLLVLPALAWAAAASAQPAPGPIETAPSEAPGRAPAPAPEASAAQPAPAGPDISEQDVATVAALQAMHACLDAQVKAADDHISPPEAIAARIKDACRAEQDRFLAAFRVFAAEHPRLEPPPDQVSDADRLAAAKAAVVEARRENR